MVTDWRDVSVLIVGCGSIGKRHARVLHDLGVRDIRAFDPVPEQREALAAEVPLTKAYQAYEAGLQDRPVAVFVCTPPHLHIPMALHAVRAGCHVFCEKPLSHTLAGVEELSAAAAMHDRKVMVGLCFRYHEGLVRARRYLEAGRIGRLVSLRALMGEHLPEVRPDYRNLFSAQYSGAFDLMHEIDLAIWYANQPVESVYAVSGTYSDIGIRAPDVAEILIRFADRCVASVHLDLFQRPRRRQTELIGTEGVIIVEFARWDRCELSVYPAAKQSWETEQIATDRDDMFRAEDREFLQAIADHLPISCTIEEARKSLEVVVAATEAVQAHALPRP
jgi:predicted dehydrogenase